MNKKVILIAISIIVFVIAGLALAFHIHNNKGENEKIYHNVEFEMDDGTLIQSIKVLHGNKVNKPNDPYKENYIFKGWFYNDKEYNFDSPVSNDLKIVATWEINIEDTNETEEVKKYKVVFDSDNGSPVPTIEVNEGEKVSAPKNPTKKDYIFVEWQLNGKKFNFDTPITSDIELKAKWNNSTNNEEIIYTVTFNSNGGTEVPSQKIKKGEKVVVPQDPTRKGFKFGGWKFKTKNYNFDDPVTSDIQLNAIWNPDTSEKTYLVSFNTNGGGTINSQTVKEGTTATEPKTPPKKDGYIFAEWQLNSQKYNFSTPVNSDIELYAKWYRIDYSIKYKGEMWPKVSLSNSSIVGYEARNDLILAAPTGIRGSEIVFYGLKPGKATITLILADQFYGNDVFYLAKLEFNITVNNDLSITEDSRRTVYGDKNCSLTSSKTYNCDYNEYFTITYDSAGGTPVSVSVAYYHPILKYSLPKTPTREGYKFKEWQLDGKKFDFNTVITKDITLVATWEEE